MTPHNPIDIAREADRLGKQSDNQAFQKIAMVCLGATAVASMGHLFLGLLRELNRRDERGYRAR